MKKTVLLVCATLILSFYTGAEAFDGLHEFVDPAVIGAGGIQLFDYKAGEEKIYRVGAVLIDAPDEIIWDILVDLEQQSHAMPYLEYQKIRKPASASLQEDSGEVIIEGRFAIESFPAQYTVCMSFDRPGMWRKWRILTPEEVESYNSSGVDVLSTSGLIKDMSGFDHLGSSDDGTKTIYYYALDMDSAIPLPEYINRSIHEALFTGHIALIKEMAESLVKGPVQGSAVMNPQDQN